MPFKSEAQRRYLWMHHPDIAKRWAHENPNQRKLAYHVRNRKRKRRRGGRLSHHLRS